MRRILLTLFVLTFYSCAVAVGNNAPAESSTKDVITNGNSVYHSKNGNILMKRRVDGKWEVRAIKKILVGDEIVSDYDKSPPFVSGPKPHYV